MTTCTRCLAVDQNVVLIGAVNGDVHAYAAGTGAPLWVRNVGGEVFSSIALANSVAYLVTDTAQTYGLNASNGKVVWSVQPQPCCDTATVSSPAESRATVYVGYGDAGVRAYTLPASMRR